MVKVKVVFVREVGVRVLESVMVSASAGANARAVGCECRREL